MLRNSSFHFFLCKIFWASFFQHFPLFWQYLDVCHFWSSWDEERQSAISSAQNTVVWYPPGFLGLWRASFYVHYLLFICIAILWYVARATLLCTAVAKTVHAHVHKYTHKHPTKKMFTSHSLLPTSSVTTTQARFRDTNIFTHLFPIFQSVIFVSLLISSSHIKVTSYFLPHPFMTQRVTRHVLGVAKLPGFPYKNLIAGRRENGCTLQN